ncbi:MAG: hypothetical protein ACYCVZ_17360 [Streptosporangiaceae bacterium]
MTFPTGYERVLWVLFAITGVAALAIALAIRALFRRRKDLLEP